MKRLRDLTLVSLVLLLLIGCVTSESWQVVYLKTAQDQATQEEVRQRLGPPRQTTPAETGKSVWDYEYWEHEYGDRIRQSGSWCNQYVLTFDTQAILRQWVRQTTRHRGEMMPTACVPGASDPKG